MTRLPEPPGTGGVRWNEREVRTQDVSPAQFSSDGAKNNDRECKSAGERETCLPAPTSKVLPAGKAPNFWVTFQTRIDGSNLQNHRIFTTIFNSFCVYLKVQIVFIFGLHNSGTTGEFGRVTFLPVSGGVLGRRPPNPSAGTGSQTSRVAVTYRHRQGHQTPGGRGCPMCSGPGRFRAPSGNTEIFLLLPPT